MQYTINHQGPRVIIYDLAHIGRRYYHTMTPLSVTKMINGVPTKIDTRIPSNTLKFITRTSNYGLYPTVVITDRPCPSRRGYFSSLKPKTSVEKEDYKGSRESAGSDFFMGMKLTEDILSKGGVTVLNAYNYEADDIIQAVIQQAKRLYPTCPIDIICNDADLIPLVDEQVSVYFRSNKYTLCDKDNHAPELNKYIQFTPNTWDKAIQYVADYKRYNLPYNSLLLVKLLRGDTADNLKPVGNIKPKQVEKLIEQMVEQGVDFENVFRYYQNDLMYFDPTDSNNQEKYIRVPQEQIGISDLKEYDIPLHYKAMYVDNLKVRELMKVLNHFIEDKDLIKDVLDRYRGINLNNAYYLKDNGRLPYTCFDKVFYGFDLDKLQIASDVLAIKIPRYKKQ